MLKIEHLVKSFGAKRAVDDISFEVKDGSLFGFVGPNGAGKTTTIKMICGLLKQDSGTITINGIQSGGSAKEGAAIKRCIGYVPDFFGVYENFKVSEYMEFYGSIYGISSADMKKLTEDLLALVNLTGKENEYVDTLSRGMKQRLCVARALIHNPALLVMDEPSSGLDPRARVEMKEILMNLQSLGKTIIISSHILADIAEMCDSVGIMSQGKLVAVDTIQNLLSHGAVAGTSVMEGFSGTDGNESTDNLVSPDEAAAIKEGIAENSIGNPSITSGAMNQDIRINIHIKSNIEEAVTVAKEFDGIKVVSVRAQELSVTCKEDDEYINRFIMEVMKRGCILYGFERQKVDLETMFMELTSNSK